MEQEKLLEELYSEEKEETAAPEERENRETVPEEEPDDGKTVEEEEGE